MCDGVSLSWRELPDVLIGEHRLERRIVKRAENADREIRFAYRDRRPLLPVWANGQLHVWTWGRGDDNGSRLPSTGWCKAESLDAGRWAWLEPETVEIPISYALQNGVWYQVVGGVQGILVHDARQTPHVYILTKPASHYYKVMTRSDRMPMFLGDGI